MSDQSYERALAVHFWAPLELIREVVPAMRARREGRIVNISSIGGIVSVPQMLPYCASKFALKGLSEGMHAELAKEGIAVTTVCPGLMRTGSVDHAFFRGQQSREHALFSIAAASPLLSMSARRAAGKIVEACVRRSPHLVLTWQAKLGSALHGLAPGFINHALAWVNRLLPPPAGALGEAREGRHVAPKLAPSWLTVLNDRAAVRYNET
ncbi:MAG TPA: SDR family NAD(P)-dependent oxidoreductase [Polyangiaceae bacterium]